jgi:AcrR family transcriptional regulator
MATHRAVSPRKGARQDRSKKTVGVILQATARVLVQEGYEACTTNRVAAAAGVSIGSLYQYFPNKESLVVAVMERHLEELQAAMAERLLALAGADLPTAVREMIRALLETQQLKPRLHRVLLEQVPRIGALRRLHELHGHYQPLVAAWLEAHADALAVKEPQVAAYVLIGAVEGVLTRVMLERPGWLDEGVLERQLTRLVLAYLSPAAEVA